MSAKLLKHKTSVSTVYPCGHCGYRLCATRPAGDSIAPPWLIASQSAKVRAKVVRHIKAHDAGGGNK